MNLRSFSLIGLARGLRRSNPALSGVSLAVLIVSWLRGRSHRGERTLLWSKELEAGEEVQFRFRGE